MSKTIGDNSYVARIKNALNSPKYRDHVKAVNEEILSYKLLTPGQVHQNSTMSNFSVQYANEEYIGTQLMPVKTVGKLSDIFYKMGQNDRRSVPNAEVGARSDVKEVNESRSTDTYSCQPYALKAFVDDLTLRNQDAPLNEMLDMVASVNDAIDFNTEKKIATAMTTSGNYLAANTSAIAAADRWDSAGGGDPIKNIQDAIDAIEMGPGSTKLVPWCSLGVARVLQRHPAFLDLFKYNSQGLVPLDQIADWFGLSGFLVGKARENTANEGQTAVKGRIWGSDYFGIARVATSPSVRTACFGLTFQMGARETSQWFDPAPGMSGGYYAKVAVAQDYKVVANDTGYLYRTCIG